MTDNEFETVIQHLTDRIDELPSAKRTELIQAVEDTRSRHHEIKAAARRAQDALDDTRLLLKYLLFDVEVSQREARDIQGRSPEEPPSD